jgi:transposase
MLIFHVLQLFSFLRGNAKKKSEWRDFFGQLWSPSRCPNLFHLVLHQFTMPRVIAQAIKDRIPVLIFSLGYTVLETCQILGIKKTTVYDTLGYYERYGTSANPHARPIGHRHRKLTANDVLFIRALIKQQHTLYLDEIQLQLLQKRNIRVSLPTLVRTLRRIHFTSKTVSVKAVERNDILRAAYMNRIGSIVTDMDQVMCVDESAKDDRTPARKRGWSLVGTRCVQRRCFVRGRRYSILPILTLDGIITYDIMEGSVTSEKFVRFLRELVVSAISSHFYSHSMTVQIPLTNPYPGPRSVLIIDNCSIHHAEEIRQLVKDEAGTQHHLS